VGSARGSEVEADRDDEIARRADSLGEQRSRKKHEIPDLIVLHSRRDPPIADFIFLCRDAR